jgi:hypothetical protein
LDPERLWPDADRRDRSFDWSEIDASSIRVVFRGKASMLAGKIGATADRFVPGLSTIERRIARSSLMKP